MIVTGVSDAGSRVDLAPTAGLTVGSIEPEANRKDSTFYVLTGKSCH